ncbi:hypothetical protein LADH09A_006190 [Micromonospora sp. LAH09]|uniref:hypothetical protein n=1 Tax=Micromonospora cabrerizensis TaxID=2911213 RepID=UPI001EE7F9FA|nr:hypothetical protein [Micromonospora cabrerizensis]MCG5472154.1 hypothetical protein [Micromonospora cabrerizensis]
MESTYIAVIVAASSRHSARAARPPRPVTGSIQTAMLLSMNGRSRTRENVRVAVPPVNRLQRYASSVTPSRSAGAP